MRIERCAVCLLTSNHFAILDGFLLLRCQFRNRVADSSSRNAVRFSSARTTQRFPSLRCALVAPTPTGFAEVVSDDFPVLHTGILTFLLSARQRQNDMNRSRRLAQSSRLWLPVFAVRPLPGGWSRMNRLANVRTITANSAGQKRTTQRSRLRTPAQFKL